MGTHILLVRHGETAWNREEIFRGREDVPLNEEGRSQAQALAAALAARPIAAVVTSPLARAAETARAIARPHRLAVTLQPAFTDIDCGLWQGRSLAEIQSTEGALFAAWRDRPESFTFPGGESLAQVRDRAMPALADLARGHEGRTVVLVAHRVVNKVILCEALGLGPAGFWRIVQSNACLNELRCEAGGLVVQQMNDTCHLAAAGRAPLAADF